MIKQGGSFIGKPDTFFCYFRKELKNFSLSYILFQIWPSQGSPLFGIQERVNIFHENSFFSGDGLLSP